MNLPGRLCRSIAVFFIASSSLAAWAYPIAKPSDAIDWLRPTGGPYPRLQAGEKYWIEVSLRRQSVDIMDGERSIYRMIVSTGLDEPSDDRTPEGTFFIQRERGASFYSARLGEGARYWVSSSTTANIFSTPCQSTGRGRSSRARLESWGQGLARLHPPEPARRRMDLREY